jgi:hypothetical protein
MILQQHVDLLRTVKRLREYAVFRKPIVMYHGTSSKFLRSIMVNGIVPKPKQKTWETDPNRGGQETRVSLTGSYWASNFLTASSAAHNAMLKFGGKKIYVIAQINEQSNLADEDSIKPCIRFAFSDMAKQLFPGLVTDAYAVFMLEFINKPETYTKAADIFSKSLHEQLSKGNTRIPLDQAHLARVFHSFLMERLASIKAHDSRNSLIREIENPDSVQFKHWPDPSLHLKNTFDVTKNEKLYERFLKETHTKHNDHSDYPELDTGNVYKLHEWLNSHDVKHDSIIVSQNSGIYSGLYVAVYTLPTIIPTQEEADSALLQDWTWLTTRYRSSAYKPEDQYGYIQHTMRNILPVGFSGHNRILAIIQENDLEKTAEGVQYYNTVKKDGKNYNAYWPLTLLYGKLPQEFITQYTERKGEYRGAFPPGSPEIKPTLSNTGY